jgi:hypothetical protein
MHRSPDARNRDLARIHVLAGARGLALTRDQYEALLFTVARVESAALLDDFGRSQVIKHLEAQLKQAGKSLRPSRRGRPTPAADKAPLVAKIRALLINAPGGARTDGYADAIAKRMFGVDQFQWATVEQLHSLVAALRYDLRRHHA